MHVVQLLSLGMMTFVLAQTPVVASAAEAAHTHASSTKGALTLDHGKRWATDSALRNGMSAIRKAMEAQHPAIHGNTLDAAGYASLAATLKPELNGIFANCHLPPAADAQLHNILLPMNASIERMQQAKTVKERREAALAVIGGLADYGKVFDHPGWQPL